MLVLMWEWSKPGKLTANNGVVAHHFEVLADEDITATSGGDEDLTQRSSLLHSSDLVALNGGLEGVDGVDFGHQDPRTHAVESLRTTLANISITSDDSDLACHHDVRRALDAVRGEVSIAIFLCEGRG